MNDNEIKENEEKNDINSSSKKENDTIKLKIGTVGNFVLAAFIIIIVGTGTLTYYLIHSAKNDYDKQYNDIVSNIINEENSQAEKDNEVAVNSVAEIIDSAITDVTSSTTTNTDVVTDRKQYKKNFK